MNDNNKADLDHYVYMLARRENERFIAPVKVGITRTLERRLSTLQTACPFEIGLVHAITVPNLQIARFLERSFHETQRDRRTRGEWFNIEPHQGLLILCLHFRWSLDAFGLDEDLAEEAIELSGAGSSAIAVLDLLYKQGVMQ